MLSRSLLICQHSHDGLLIYIAYIITSFTLSIDTVYQKQNRLDCRLSDYYPIFIICKHGSPEPQCLVFRVECFFLLNLLYFSSLNSLTAHKTIISYPLIQCLILGHYLNTLQTICISFIKHNNKLSLYFSSSLSTASDTTSSGYPLSG